MKKKTAFYIGWQEKMPTSIQQFLKPILLFTLIFILLMVIALVWFQKPFNNHVFEFGVQKSYSGILTSNPVVMLHLDEKYQDLPFDKEVLLVGFGKFGALSLFEKWQRELGNLEKRKVSIKGSLIYGSNKALIEVKDDLPIIYDTPSLTEKAVIPSKNEVFTALQGEIIDPKCYFGVMKPGEGKIHKSCAIRCISGGIPPVYKVKQGSVFNYFLLFDSKGYTPRASILDYVGEQITISGRTKDKKQGWDYFYADLSSIKRIK